MRTFNTTLICLLCFTMAAQSWCPPNASWYYTCNNITWTGYTNLNYAGTVTVNGQTCQQLNYSGQRYDVLSQSTVNVTHPPIYTLYSSNTVFLYDNAINNFDTLYCFSAAPGQQWLLPAINTLTQCSKSVLTVMDTGHHLIQTVNLRWLRVKINANIYDTIYERIGFLNNYFFSYDNCTSMFDYVEGGPLRCYGDAQIVNFKRYAPACNYYPIPTSIEKNPALAQFEIFPNPVKDKLTVNSVKCDKLTITNVLGEIIFVEKDPSTKFDIDLRVFPTGVYYLKAEINSANRVYKIIKE